MAAPPRILTISPDNVKPFTGKIVGKVPPGMLRFATSPSTVIQTNQVYLTSQRPNSGQEDREPGTHQPDQAALKPEDKEESEKVSEGDEDVSLACTEEFDDSFEKKEEVVGRLFDEIDEEEGGEQDVDETKREEEDSGTKEDAGEGEEEVEEEEIDDDEKLDEEEDSPGQEGEELGQREEGGIETVDLLKPLPGPGTNKEDDLRVETNEFGMMEIL